MLLDIKKFDGFDLLVFRPKDLDEARQYPGSCKAMAFWPGQGIDIYDIKHFVEECIKSIGHGRTLG